MLVLREIRSIARLVLSVIMGVALLSLTPVSVQAQEPVDLILGSEGAISWLIENIQPGDNGTKALTLHNAGYKDGEVTIWITDIVSSEGTNPESETGDTAEPGELDQYLLFNVLCSRLTTNINLPTRIDGLPGSASSSKYIMVSRLNAGDSIDLDWQWELPAPTGNDIQGDSLSFTINYMLEELPSGGGGDDGDDGDDDTPPIKVPLLLRVDMWGKVTSGKITPEGVLLDYIDAVSADGSLALLFPSGTSVLDRVDNPVNLIEVNPVVPPEPPPDKRVIGSGYDIQPSCTFDPPIAAILHYSQEALNNGVSGKDLVIAYYDRDLGKWIILPTFTDIDTESVRTSLSRSSILAVLAPVSELAITDTPETVPLPTPDVTPSPTPDVPSPPSSKPAIWIWMAVSLLVILLGLIVWRLIRLRLTSRVG